MWIRERYRLMPNASNQGGSHLVKHYDVLKIRAEKTAELGRRALALGINPDLQVGSLAKVAAAVAARSDAEAGIEANARARELLGARWRGSQSDRPPLMNALHAAYQVERASLPEPIRRYLYDADRDARIGELKHLHTELTEALCAVVETWDNTKAWQTRRGGVL